MLSVMFDPVFSSSPPSRLLAALVLVLGLTFPARAAVVVDLNSPDDPSINVSTSDSWIPMTAPLARLSFADSGAPGITDLDGGGVADDFLDYNRFSVTEPLTPGTDYRGLSFFGGLTRRQFNVKNLTAEPEDSGQVVSPRNGRPAYINLALASGKTLGSGDRTGEYAAVVFVDKVSFLAGGDVRMVHPNESNDAALAVVAGSSHLGNGNGGEARWLIRVDNQFFVSTTTFQLGGEKEPTTHVLTGLEMMAGDAWAAFNPTEDNVFVRIEDLSFDHTLTSESNITAVGIWAARSAKINPGNLMFWVYDLAADLTVAP